jgi:hypothetical protein
MISVEPPMYGEFNMENIVNIVDIRTRALESLQRFQTESGIITIDTGTLREIYFALDKNIIRTIKAMRIVSNDGVKCIGLRDAKAILEYCKVYWG